MHEQCGIKLDVWMRSTISSEPKCFGQRLFVMPCCHDKPIIGNIAEVEIFEDGPVYAIVPSLAIYSPSHEVEAPVVYQPRGNLMPPVCGY